MVLLGVGPGVSLKAKIGPKISLSGKPSILF